MLDNAELIAIANSPEAWRGRRVLILGAGASGFSAADTLVEFGAEVLVLAQKVEDELFPLFRVIGAEPELFDREQDMLERAQKFDPELVLVSPSFAPQHQLVAHYRELDGPLFISEIELSWLLRKPGGAEWITIAGETAPQVAALAERLLISAGRSAMRFGFGSAAVLDGIRLPDQPEFFLITLSPQQLYYQQNVSPLISVFLNPDTHSSWHPDLPTRMFDQARIFRNTRAFAIYNRSDDLAEMLLRESDVVEGCRAIGYWLASPGPSDLGVVEELVVDRAYLDDRKNSALELSSLDELQQAGFLTREDFEIFIAACAVVRPLGVSPEQITATLGELRAESGEI